MNPIVSDQDAQAALNYLAQTDIEHAAKKAELNAKKDLTKTVLAYEFADATGAQEARKMQAFASDSYRDHINAISTLEIDYQTMHNKRDRARLTIELWRSVNANRRQGNI